MVYGQGNSIVLAIQDPGPKLFEPPYKMGYLLRHSPLLAMMSMLSCKKYQMLQANINNDLNAIPLQNTPFVTQQKPLGDLWLHIGNC